MKILRGELLLEMAALVWLTGCASIGPPVPPSLELPKPPSDLRAVRKGDRVTLTWSIPERTTDRQRLRYLGKTRICRSIDEPLKQCEKAVAEAAAPADFAAKKSAVQKIKASFVDVLPSAFQQAHALGFATYAVEVLNTAGRGAGISNLARVPLLATLPRVAGFSAQVTAHGIALSWQCPALSNPIKDGKYWLRIYRRAESRSSEARIADSDISSCVAGAGGTGNFLDQTFEWEQTYFYRGTLVSVLEIAGKPPIEVEGDDTPEVKVFAEDVFPPAVPSGVQAVYSGTGQRPFIDLIWAPAADLDLDGYNIYRHERGTAPEKINTELVKTPAYRDMRVNSGTIYFYSVSAVDRRGNESSRSEETSEQTP